MQEEECHLERAAAKPLNGPPLTLRRIGTGVRESGLVARWLGRDAEAEAIEIGLVPAPPHSDLTALASRGCQRLARPQFKRWRHAPAPPQH